MYSARYLHFLVFVIVGFVGAVVIAEIFSCTLGGQLILSRHNNMSGKAGRIGASQSYSSGSGEDGRAE